MEKLVTYNCKNCGGQLPEFVLNKSKCKHCESINYLVEIENIKKPVDTKSYEPFIFTIDIENTGNDYENVNLLSFNKHATCENYGNSKNIKVSVMVGQETCGWKTYFDLLNGVHAINLECQDIRFSSERSKFFNGFINFNEL